MNSKPDQRSIRASLAIPFIPLLAALWALTHRYQGFARDGELYAVQALSRLQPQLAADLYLQNTSQDHYTVFSPLYAWLIGIMGLQNAELLLFAACSIGFLAGAWFLARELSDGDAAWLTVALFVVTIGYYGAYQIFSYSENYLTARSLAEALIVAALACHVGGRRGLALAVAACAMFIHPLMALPGVMLLVFLWLPLWSGAALSGLGLLTALGIAVAASQWPGVLTVLDPAWLEVVRERSQFLFLQYWTPTDWEVTARPFVCLTLAALVTRQAMVQRLCFAAMLIGASGLLVAWIAGAVGPVAILLQGQAWRWAWITGFVSVLLVVPTVIVAAGDVRGGPLVAILLILGWTYSGVDGLACAEGALVLWLARGLINTRAARLLRWAAAALALIIIVTVIANCWTIASSPIPESGREPVLIGRVREVFGMGVSAVLLMALAWMWLRRHRNPRVHAFAAAAFAAAAVATLPGAVKQLSPIGTRADIEEFADWRERIPPTSTVLIVPTTKSASFAWFTLGRPSYLSVDQSSGVVFSRATAQEVRRRSQVLLAVAEPDWQILTQIEQERAGLRKKVPEPKPLTAASLSDICRDPELGFVIAKPKLAFDPAIHRHLGNWKDWNLYDCRRVRAEPQA